jgi:hypothetical protein
MAKTAGGARNLRSYGIRHQAIIRFRAFLPNPRHQVINRHR